MILTTAQDQGSSLSQRIPGACKFCGHLLWGLHLVPNSYISVLYFGSYCSMEDLGNLWIVKEAYGYEGCTIGQPILCGSTVSESIETAVSHAASLSNAQQ